MQRRGEPRCRKLTGNFPAKARTCYKHTSVSVKRTPGTPEPAEASQRAVLNRPRHSSDPPHAQERVRSSGTKVTTTSSLTADTQRGALRNRGVFFFLRAEERLVLSSMALMFTSPSHPSSHVTGRRRRAQGRERAFSNRSGCASAGGAMLTESGGQPEAEGHERHEIHHTCGRRRRR